MFQHLRLPCLLGAMLLVSACKSKPQETTPAPATPSSNAAAPAKPPEPAPVSDDTLSFVEKGGEKCKWVRLDALRGTRREVFTFDGACELAELAWSHDGRKGAVLQSFEEERPPRAWVVDLGTGQGTVLPLPEVGLTTELGFDPEGRPVALVAHHEMPHTPGVKPPERVEENGQASFVFEGQKYPMAELGGTPGLAHAYRREGDGWRRVETKLSSYEWDMAGETRVLDIVKTLGPNTRLDSKEGLESQSVSKEEAAALAKSTPAKTPEPGGAEGEEVATDAWARFATPGGPLYYREEQAEFVSPSLPLRWEVGGKLVEPEKLALPEGSTISLATRGNLLFVTSGEAARLYDAKQKKHLASLNGVYQPRFWPRPQSASGKPATPPAPAPSQGAPGTLSMKLDDPRAAFDFLAQADVNLKEGKEGCADLAENGTLGKLVKKARADATEWSVQCSAPTGTKIWSCKAEFIRSGGEEEEEEATGFAIQLLYSVDDTARAIQPGSLVCRIAG